MTDYASIPDVLTISDLQKMFQIGRSTAYRLIKTNQVRSIRKYYCIIHKCLDYAVTRSNLLYAWL